MKQLQLIFFLFAFICLKQVKSQTADITTGCAPLTVNFTSPSSASTFFWDFKDQTTSVLSNPSTTFLSPGTYVVEFKETVNGPILGTISILVLEKPTPTFITDTNKGCSPLAVIFTNTTTISPPISLTSSSWVFGDGGSASGDPVSHTFFGSRTFFVSLELKTNFPSCDVTKKFDDVISTSISPNVSFTTTPPVLVACTPPFNVSFTNTSTSNIAGPLSYTWNFGNSQTSIVTNPPDQTYSSDGRFTIELVATDTNNCSNSRIRVASIGSPIPNLRYKDTFCINVVDTIFNFSPGNSIWTFPSDATFMGYHQEVHPILSFASSGSKTFSLRLNAGNCTTDSSFSIFVEEVMPDFIINPTYSCSYPFTVTYTSNSSSNAVSFLWQRKDRSNPFDFEQFSSQKDPSFTYTDPFSSTYDVNRPEIDLVKLFAITRNGCRDSIIKSDTVHRPNALILPNVSNGCLPLAVTFTNASDKDIKHNLVQWEWFFGDGTSITSTNSSSQTHTYTTMGHYYAYLVITNAIGCSDTSYSTLIKVGDTITPNFVVDNTDICIGDTVQFTDITSHPLKDSIDTWHYSTESDRMFSCFGEANPPWSYTNEVGSQDVTMTVGFNGCFTSITKPALINVKGAVAKIHYNYYCENPFTVNFQDSSINATSILWQFGDGDSSISSAPSHTYTSTGDYQVILRAENTGSGCAPTYDTTTIFIRNIKSVISADSLFCIDVPSPLHSPLSEDVDVGCARGFQWLFSDTLMRPLSTNQDSSSVYFRTPGTTNITLITTDINGCKDTSEQKIRAYSIDAQFTLDDSTICLPTTVNFSDLSTSDTTIVSWAWNFGNFDFSFAQSPSYQYSTNSIINRDSNGIILPYKVFFQVENNVGCVDNDSLFINLYELESKISILDSTICTNSPVDLSASDFTSQGSSLNFNWNFKDGNFSQQQAPSHLFQSAGEFPIELAIEEISSGCKDTITSNVSVRDFPIAGFSMSSDSIPIVCPNENILFTDTTISPSTTLRYNWNFGNGNTSIFKDPGTVYTDNGTYTIQQIAFEPTPYGCADTTSRTVTVRGPMGRFITDLNGDTICRLESVNFNLVDTMDVDNYRWDFGDGSGLDNVSPISHQYTFVPPSGRTIAKLVLSNADGSCPVTQEEIINIYEVVADFERNNGLDTAICFAPYSVNNLSLNANSWNWNFGNGSSSTQFNPSPIIYNQPGTYQIQLSVHNNRLQCTDTIVKEIILYPNPQLIVIGDTICENDTAFISTLNPDSNWTYTWTSNFNASINDINAPNTSTTPSVTTEYYNIVIDTNNCVDLDTATVFVLNPLNLTDFDTTIIIGDSINLPVNVNAGLYLFSWSPTDGLNCIDCSPPRVAPLNDISYSLQLTDVLGCFSYNANFDIDIYPETFIEMPTSFTPNGDGVNDLIFVEGWGIKDLLDYKILNRWGEVVFETTDITKGWDGKYNGVLQNNDVYAYKVLVRTWRNEEKSKEGYINLIR